MLVLVPVPVPVLVVVSMLTADNEGRNDGWRQWQRR